jgi:hypothetical protein
MGGLKGNFFRQIGMVVFVLALSSVVWRKMPLVPLQFFLSNRNTHFISDARQKT